MRFLLNLISLLVITGYMVSAQDAHTFPPYTIEATYQKLKNNYPFVTPIKPLVSKNINYHEDVVYKEIGDRKLNLDIYVPKKKKSKSFPAVLLIHGGGWLTGSKENQRIMAQYLALNGYVGISASYRLGLEAPYPAGVIDLKDAIVWMRKNAKKYHINPDKIAVLGASAGAHLATLIGVTPNSPLYESDAKISDEVQAIINIDGITSFIHPEASSEGKMASIWLNGSKEENYKYWKEASPLEYVNENTPPTLFINSAQPRFHAGRDDMVAILDSFQIYNEVHTISKSPHSFWLVYPWFETTLDYTVNFLNKVLKLN
ncbi:alpha/beta hydrolase fold domain-containing protein [Mariniflexile gromovii]|uniref:Alpha/beta hydrolase n=1 Tax=Mariniflexile gromovii TaxID=362523 RepID=A0ABS4BUF3_9FLAO|nr:alpha/beta hydrolase [Mariniflexile gromovii]MBP0904218.1 alpha/beta hydrolase [Mariniflexile gromovii]